MDKITRGTKIKILMGLKEAGLSSKYRGCILPGELFNIICRAIYDENFFVDVGFNSKSFKMGLKVPSVNEEEFEFIDQIALYLIKNKRISRTSGGAVRISKEILSYKPSALDTKKGCA